MKNILLAGCLALYLLPTEKALGQDSLHIPRQDSLHTPRQDSLPLFTYTVDGDSITSNVPLNELCASAYRDFKEDHKNIHSIQWIKYSAGISATFQTADSTLYHVNYSSRGRRLNTFVYYPGRNSPRDLRSTLSRQYKGYSIIYTSELIDGAHTLFETGITDNKKVKILEIDNGDITILKEYLLSDPAGLPLAALPVPPKYNP